MAGKAAAFDEMGSNVVPSVKKEAKVRIILEDSVHMSPGGQFICFNGRTWLIQAGVEVEVPIGVLEVLDNAIESIPVIDPNTGRAVRQQVRKRFPYTRLSIAA